MRNADLIATLSQVSASTLFFNLDQKVNG